MKPCTTDANRTGEHGATFVLVAFFLLFLLGAAALAIDLGMLYVTRSEAQRTADAAALAAANTFSACAPSATCETPGAEAIATTAALQSAQANPVLGLSPTGTCTSGGGGNSQTQQACMSVAFSDPTLASSNPGTEPQATVTIQRTGIQLIFAKMFNQRIGQVSAVATAEYYQGNGVAACVTPFLVPNCDPNSNDAETPNGNCGGGTYGGFVNATITGTAPYYTVTSTVANPELYDPSGTSPGALGEPWTLHFAYPNSSGTIGPSGSVTPSQWSVAAFTSNSANAVAQEIAECPPVNIACGSLVNTKQGNTPMMVDSAVDGLIHHNPCNGQGSGPNGCGSQDGPGTGQDALNASGGTLSQPYPTSFDTTCLTPNTFSFTVGSWNTGPSEGTTQCANLGSSASIIEAPIYQGNGLSPGMNQVIIVGYLELFIDYSQFVSVPGQGAEETVQANVLSIQNCGSGGPGSTVAASPVPIRLIQGPN